MIMFSFFFLMFIFLSQWFHSKADSSGKNNKDYVVCLTHRSWSEYNNCSHAFGSVLNPSIVVAEYDTGLAYKMVFLSALAYAGNIATYIHKATEVNTFRLVKQVAKDCSGDAKCSGYTAISHTERAIVLAFRGTQHFQQLIQQVLRIVIEPKVSFLAGGKVQGYFNDAFFVVWQDLKNELYQLISQYPSYKVWVTGHSLGGAMASLASALIAYDGKTTKTNLILYTFGQPRVGNYDYALTHDKLVPISFRVTHYRDPVVHLPACNKVVRTTPCLIGGPYHHGNEIFYGNETMTKDSSFKKCKELPHNKDLGCSNSLLAWAQCFLPTEIDDCIGEHTSYFGISVGKWWRVQSPKNSCNTMISCCFVIVWCVSLVLSFNQFS